MVVAPANATCLKGKGTIIDYFIVHRALRHLVKAEAVDNGSIRTHTVVRLAISGAARRHWWESLWTARSDLRQRECARERDG